MIRNKFRRLVIASLSFLLTLPVVIPLCYADPPPHAAAHGWRKKHDPYYQGYTGKQWSKDYGVYSGRCNREAIGALIGGAIGGVVGSRVGAEEHRAVATIAGVVIGAVVGAKIGREIDEGDRACMGHALELAKNRQSVSWLNKETGVNYQVTPLRDRVVDGRACREFETRLSEDGKNSVTRSTACRGDRDVWQVGDSSPAKKAGR